MCSPPARLLFISQPSCHGSSPSPLSVSPFPSPCNLTLSTLVSCLVANTDCSRLGLDFPVLASPLLRFIFQSISTPTPYSLTHSHVFLLPHTLPIFVWFLRTCVFLANTPPLCSFYRCLFSNLRLFSSFQPQIDFLSCYCSFCLSTWQPSRNMTLYGDLKKDECENVFWFL